MIEIEEQFGSDVARLVAEVTDDKSLPKQVRKDLQVEHARRASPGAQTIKMADKISNLRSLATSPPEDWNRDRVMEYGLWAAKVVAGCREANAELAEQFDAAFASLMATQ
ncbi:MAG: HD domain-containing protein [Sphingopyxis sp.]|uniref:HD domain-containing protein n=1 Tax=Sphingopyxis sp. TaxID=1908224 RepID=UPI003D6C7CFB